jgi:hypothetical protein
MNLHPLQSSHHRKKLLGVLLIALIAGLFYTYFIPPWQHYDEPTQFEYAWLIANRPGLPQLGITTSACAAKWRPR